MNVGRVFEQDGLYRLIVRLGDDWPQVKRFTSLSEMLMDLQSAGLPFEELVDFSCRGLHPKGKIEQLPGHTQDWVAYLGQE